MSYRQVFAREFAKDATNTLVRRKSGSPVAAGSAFAVPGAVPGLEPFSVGALGNFPYYWQDPATLDFNAKTYSWISASLRARADPVQLGQPFTNLYIDALSKVYYSLSSADQAQLNRDQQNAVSQQGALLLAWRNAFGSIPAPVGTRQPIDLVLQTITTEWATPPLTLTQLQAVPDLGKALNTMPVSGKTVLGPLAKYLSALNQGIPLLNQTVMNSGYLQQALAAVQMPAAANGGLMTSDGQLRPAFRVATPLQQILDGLDSKHASAAFSVDMSVTASSPEQYVVTFAGGAEAVVPAADFLNIETDATQDLLGQTMTADPSPTAVGLGFTGVTMVYFGPADFSQSAAKDWYWPSAITDAIDNQGEDVSGFKFSPRPQIDFSKAGPFAFLVGVAISRSPSVKIVHRGSDFKQVAESVEASPMARMSFLTQPLSSRGDTSSEYRASVVTDEAAQTAEIHFVAAGGVAGDAMDSTAFVLGVLPDRPTA